MSQIPNIINLITSNIADPTSKSQKSEHCFARIVFAGVARKMMYSYSEIAEILSKHRTTVYHYEAQCNRSFLKEHYHTYRRIVKEIETNL